MMSETELAELVEKQKAEIGKLTASEQKLRQSITRYVEADVKRAIEAAGGPGVLLLPNVMKEIRVVEDGDDFKSIVVGKDGKTPRIKNGSGDAMSIEDLVAEFKTRPEFAGAFSAAGSGEGTQPSRPGHKISAAEAKDNTRYTAAKRAAEEAGVELEITDREIVPANTPGAHKISATDARDNRKWITAKEAAEKAGVPLEVVS